MKILHIQKFFYQHGGGSTLFFKLSKLLAGHGHEVAFFSMHSPQNKKSYWSKFFVSNIDYQPKNYGRNLRLFFRSLYSSEARNKIRLLLDEFKPDIAHLHDIYHHLSPSILLELSARKIPIVQSLSDYHLIAPNYNLFHDGRICEKTKAKKFYKAVFHRCVKQSIAASTAEISEKYFHQFTGWEKNLVDLFIVPSGFMRDKLIKYKLPGGKIFVLPHFVDYRSYKSDIGGNYLLFFGRLSEEKGIKLLINAVKNLPNIKLYITGRGPQEAELKDYLHRYKISNIRLTGYIEGTALKKLISGSRFTILPSVWFEVFGLSILESFASYKPVIGSRIGAIPEIIRNNYNGMLFKPNDQEDLQNKIVRLWNDRELYRRLSLSARRSCRDLYDPERYYRKLMAIYDLVRR